MTHEETTSWFPDHSHHIRAFADGCDVFRIRRFRHLEISYRNFVLFHCLRDLLEQDARTHQGRLVNEASGSSWSRRFFPHQMEEYQMDEERIKTGFRDLDELTGGFRKGELILLGARLAMGKTSFAENLAENISASHDGIALQFSAGRFGQGFWLPSLIERCRRLAENNSVCFIIIDDLQSIRTRRLKRKGSLSKALITLKKLARELSCPILVVSNVNRTIERRKDRRPQLHDFTRCQNAGRIADTVLMLYRDRYYNLDSEAGNTAEIIVLKHRDGTPGTVYLTWDYQQRNFLVSP